MTVRSLESVHRLRYFRFCNVLHIWTIRAIPTYRVVDSMILSEVYSALPSDVEEVFTISFGGGVKPLVVSDLAQLATGYSRSLLSKPGLTHM